jgi:hypothetical protein
VFDPGSPWNEVGIHGIPRFREWEVVASADSERLTGEEVHFVAVPDGSLIVDEDVPDGSVVPLARAVEHTVEAPYRARGVRRSGSVWAVGALRIAVTELPKEFAGDELELVVRGGAPALHVDGRPAFSVPAGLEALAPGQGDYVVRARRLDETLWEAEVDAL